MKELITTKTTLLLLLLTISSFAQPYVSITADVRNGIKGSAPTNGNPELDVIFKAGAVAYNGAPIKVGIIYEKFNALDFERYCAEVGYDFLILKPIHLQPSGEFGWIDRHGNTFWTYGLNVDFIYYLNDNLGVVLNYNLNKASDTDAIWNEKGNWRNNFSVGFTWRFDKYKGR